MLQIQVDCIKILLFTAVIEKMDDNRELDLASCGEQERSVCQDNNNLSSKTPLEQLVDLGFVDAPKEASGVINTKEDQLVIVDGHPEEEMFWENVGVVDNSGISVDLQFILLTDEVSEEVVLDSSITVRGEEEISQAVSHAKEGKVIKSSQKVKSTWISGQIPHLKMTEKLTMTLLVNTNE